MREPLVTMPIVRMPTSPVPDPHQPAAQVPTSPVPALRVPTLRVHLLGEFALAAHSDPAPDTRTAWAPTSPAAAAADWQRAAPRRLLKWLALAPRHSLAADSLMRRLWPDDDSPRRRQRLHHLVYLLRAALASAAPSAVPWVRQYDGSVSLSGPIAVDVVEFEQALAAALAEPDAGPQAVHAALARYGGPLLPGETDDESINQRRLDLEQRYVAGWFEAARRYRLRGTLDAAIDCLQRVVALAPAHEAAHCALIEMHAQQGRRDRVERQYLACKTALAAEFDVMPSARTHQAYRLGMGVSDGTAAATGTPARTPARRPTRMPALPPLQGPLIGRDDALRTLQSMLAAQTRRLVTLTGPGGVGKTQLALHAAHAVAATRAEGVTFAALADARTSEAVIEQLLRAVGAQAGPTEAPLDALVAALQDRPLLVVLDNCEQVIASLGFLAALLQHCPELTLLATSRRRLNLQAESVIALRGLDLTAQAAMRLFSERARVVQPQFDADAHADDVRAIVQQLDGLPLAIELVAARAHVYSPAQLRAALAVSLAPACGGGADRPPRHRSLEDSLRWSLALLDAPSRAQLGCVMRFAGPFDAAALQSVAAQPEPTFGAALQALVELHLLVPAPAQPSAAPRWTLLPGLRSALEATIEAPAAAADARFIAWFAQRCAQADAALDTAQAAGAVAQFDADRENLFAALALADAADDAAALCALVRNAARYWIRARSWERARVWVQRAQALAPRLEPSARSPLLLSLAMFWIEVQEFECACETAAQVMALTDGAAEVATQLRATLLHSAASLHLGQGARAIPALQRARQLARAAQEPAFVPAILNNLGTALLAQGDLARAQRAWRTAERAAAPEAPQRVSLLHNLSLVAHYRGQYAQALAYSDAAEQAHARSAPDRPARRALLLVRRSWLWSCQGRAAEAHATLAQAREAAIAAGLDVWERVCTAHAGKAALIDGRPAQAAALLQQGLAACLTLADRWDLLDLQLWLFWAQRALPGQAERTRRTLDHAIDVARGAFRQEHARVLEAAALWLWDQRRIGLAAQAWRRAEALRQRQGIRRFPAEQQHVQRVAPLLRRAASDVALNEAQNDMQGPMRDGCDMAWLDAVLAAPSMSSRSSRSRSRTAVPTQSPA